MSEEMHCPESEMEQPHVEEEILLSEASLLQIAEELNSRPLISHVFGVVSNNPDDLPDSVPISKRGAVVEWWNWDGHTATAGHLLNVIGLEVQGSHDERYYLDDDIGFELDDEEEDD